MIKNKNFFTSFFLGIFLLISVHDLRADILSKQFFEDVVKNLFITSCTTAIYGAGFVYALYYLQKHQEESVITPKGEAEKNNPSSDDKDNKDEETLIKVYYPGAIKTTFNDVAGLAGAKADLQDIIAYIKHPQQYKKIGAKVPKGVLMQGGPGNGKTLLARAVAGEVNCPFVSISGSSFADMYVGVGAKRVRMLFKMAEKLADQHGACVIFIDEIDAFAQKRSGIGTSGDRDFNQTIAEFLKCMDGLEKDTRPIIVLAATNRIQALDNAVLRPGRFDRKVEVTKPEIQDRVKLLDYALKSVTHAPTIDVARFARITSGFSGAELTQLVNEGALLAVNAGRGQVIVDDLELAYDHITLGRELQGLEFNDQDRWVTAIHEAGHAVGYVFEGNNRYVIHKASIIPRSKTLGVVWTVVNHESHSYTQADMKAKITVALCGSLAEQAFGFEQSTGLKSDLAQARAIAYDMVVSYGMSDKLKYISYDEIDQYLPDTIATEVYREVQKIIDECFQQAEKIVRDHKQEIEKVARLLMKKGTVLGDEIYALFQPRLASLQGSIS